MTLADLLNLLSEFNDVGVPLDGEMEMQLLTADGLVPLQGIFANSARVIFYNVENSELAPEIMLENALDKKITILDSQLLAKQLDKIKLN